MNETQSFVSVLLSDFRDFGLFGFLGLAGEGDADWPWILTVLVSFLGLWAIFYGVKLILRIVKRVK